MRVAITLTIALASSIAAAETKEVAVSAGKLDRQNALIRLPASGLDPQKPWRLKDSGGATVAVQVLPDGTAVAVLPELKCGTSKTLTLEASVAKADAQAVAQRQSDNVNLDIFSKHVLRYNGDKTPLPEGFEQQFQRGGYVYPVYTPSGVIVLDDYPPKHKHHHGIWTPWTKTVFEGRKPDFWNMGAKTGTVEFVELVRTFQGPVAAGLVSTHRMVDLTARPDPKPAIDETWNVTAYAVGSNEAKKYYLFDLVSTQACASDSPLILPKYHYGGFGLRGRREWDGKSNCFFLTSEGKTRADGNETRARWIHIGGEVDGKLVGIATLCHPDNFRFPQPVRIHPDEPYFSYAPQQLGEFKIEPGKPYISRYRFIVTDGAPDKDLIERLWNDYASPVDVSMK